MGRGRERTYGRTKVFLKVDDDERWFELSHGGGEEVE